MAKIINSLSEIQETPEIKIDVTKGPEQLAWKGRGKVLVKCRVNKAIAKWMMDNRQPVNRHINKSKVKEYEADMVSGKWFSDTANSNICFDSKGRGINLQHRCSAIIDADITIPMYLELGSDHNEVADSNLKRSVSDSLAIEGLGKDLDSGYVLVCRNIMRILSAHSYVDGAPAVDGAKTSATMPIGKYSQFVTDNMDSLKEMYKECGEIFSDENTTNYYNYKARLMKPQVYAYCWILHNVCGYDYKTIREFFKSIKSATPVKYKNLDMVRRMFMKNAEHGNEKYDIRYVDYLVRYFWNAWVLNKNVKSTDLLKDYIFDRRVSSVAKLRKVEYVQFISAGEVKNQIKRSYHKHTTHLKKAADA